MTHCNENIHNKILLSGNAPVFRLATYLLYQSNLAKCQSGLHSFLSKTGAKLVGWWRKHQHRFLPSFFSDVIGDELSAGSQEILDLWSQFSNTSPVSSQVWIYWCPHSWEMPCSCPGKQWATLIPDGYLLPKWFTDVVLHSPCCRREFRSPSRVPSSCIRGLCHRGH